MPVITDEEWMAYEEVRSILKFPYEATVQMQAVQYTLSDFYAVWVDLKIKLAALKGNELADDIVKGMEKKENDRQILTSPPILSCVFLDARYRDLLDNAQIGIAVRHITDLWHTYRQIVPDEDPSDENVPENLEEITCLKDLLKAKQRDRMRNANLFCVNDENALKRVQLMPYNDDLQMSTVKFWARFSSVEPKLLLFQIKKKLNKLACIINAAAPTQTRVEAAFSGLTFILNPYRSGLSDISIDRILTIRLNKQLLDLIKMN